MNITEFILAHPELSQMDFATVYYTIATLIGEGYVISDLGAINITSER